LQKTSQQIPSLKRSRVEAARTTSAPLKSIIKLTKADTNQGAELLANPTSSNTHPVSNDAGDGAIAGL
jgi:hypothetical protein